MHLVRRLLVLAIASSIALLAVPAIAAAEANLKPETELLQLPDTDIHEEVQSATVKVSNEGETGAEVTEVEIEGDSEISIDQANTTCLGALVEPGENCAVAVAADPSVEGEIEALVVVKYSDGEEKAISFAVTCHGRTGTLEAASPNFNVQPYFYGSVEAQVQVHNVSIWKTRIEGLTITGPDASAFSVNPSCPVPSTLFGFNTCNLQVFFSAKAGGNYEADLEVENDGTVAPLVIPLEAESLRGPEVAITPAEGVDFGAVEVGTVSKPQPLTIENVGDSPLVVQQLLVISGTPTYFPLSENGCTGQVLMPAGTCEFSVGFNPGRGGEKSASVFVIGNGSGPVTTAPIVGEGLYAPNGSASLSAQAQVGVPIYCFAHGFHEYDELSYSWFKGGNEIAGETDSVYVPVAADAGATVACRISAENAVGSEAVTSGLSAPVAAAATGPEGPAGPEGAKGQEGAKGEAGATGQTGQRGPKGAKGPKGDRGPRGHRGPKGKKHRKHNKNHHRKQRHGR